MISSTVPDLAAIRGQERVFAHLRALVRKGRMPHALLFTGIDGVGKRTTALALAQACNCQEPTLPDAEGVLGCGRCRPCRLIASGQHPDLYRLEPSGQFIRTDQVRELLRALAIRPYEARTRVVVLAEAHMLHPAAGNALLKLLEEPPPQTLIVLTARQVSDLMPTIVSRCQRMTFAPLPEKVLIALLTEKAAMDEPSARILARLCGGSVTQAWQLGRANWIQRRRWLIDELQHLGSRSAAQRVSLAETLTADRAALPVALQVMQLWLRDLLVWRIDPGRIVNGGQFETRPVAALLGQVDALRRAQRDLLANANPRLAMDTLMLRMVDA